jgi:predicted metal-dependent phosphoesterase TrpH
MLMPVVADLHIHTTGSDGLLSPSEIVNLAESAKLVAIAITDHDTIGGIEEALAESQNKNVEVIPGIELSTEFQDSEIHILGLYINHRYSALTELLEKLHKSRFLRAEKMVAKLCSLGYHIDLDAVLRQARDAAPGRPHVARALVEKGYIASVSEAFDTLLGYKMPGYVQRYKLTPKEAITIIREAGGISAWAHPGLTGQYYLLKEFKSYGLTGLEAYHPDHHPSQVEHYKKLARESALFVSGGSDFHGREAGHTRELAYCGLSQQELANIQDIWRNTLV